jgi:hypothetical protein
MYRVILIFLHLSFSLPFFSGWQSHPAKREPSVLFRAHRHAGSTEVEPEQKAFRAAPAKREPTVLFRAHRHAGSTTELPEQKERRV